MTIDADSARRWIVTHLGSREHYACPVSFQRRGGLRFFYTDLWSPRTLPLIHRIPGPMHRLSRRFHPELPREKVIAFNKSSLFHDLRWRLSHRKPSMADEYQNFAEVGQWFARKVVHHLARQKLDSACDTLFAFSTGALETLHFARDQGMLAILDQLDPHRVDENMTREEALRWEGWEASAGERPQSFHDRIFQEWAAADLIVVNSNFSRTALIGQGADAAKIVVVPLAYESEAQGAAARTSAAGKPLEVLWLGQVVLRKGIPYLFEAARLLQGQNVRFHVAGRIGINASAVGQAPGNVKILGQVTRQRAIELYKSADVFVLPTISDGFAITQIEAMSYGLPVITTPNCGDVVTPGIDGEIIPIRDPAALADAIMRFADDRTLLAAMSAKALEKSRQFTMDRYARTIECAANERWARVRGHAAREETTPMRPRDGSA